MTLNVGTAVLGRPAPQVIVAGLIGIAGGLLAVLIPGGVLLLLVVPPIAFVLGRAERIFASVLIGAIVLTYGFANVGLRVGPLPVPLADLALLGLAAYALRRLGPISAIGVPGLILVGYFAFAAVRLLVDFPTWGLAAIRDFTTPLESLATFVAAFLLTRRLGVRWAVLVWALAFAIVSVYALLYPVRDTVAAAGPTVGLQQPIPLLNYDGIGIGLGGAFLFFLLVTQSSVISSLVIVAPALIIVMVQARGMYLFLPIALLVAFVAGGRVSLRTRNAARLAGASVLLVAIMIGAAVFDIRPTGRLGPVDPGFAASQLVTLLGQEGPGSGSFQHRLGWLRESWDRVSVDPVTLLFGIGLGPDLAGGFAINPLVLVRKPHNDYLELLVRLGIVGSTLWLGFIASTLVAVWHGVGHRRHDRETSGFLVWTLSASTLYLGIAATQPLLAFVYGTVPLFSMFGMGLALATQYGDRASDAAP